MPRILFYPRPPRGGRRLSCTARCCWPSISTHALREEGDTYTARLPRARMNFYPRPPRGGRRAPGPAWNCRWGYFYPRLPRGGRLPRGCCVTIGVKFLPTPSARRATGRKEDGEKPVVYFYPRPPRGGRLADRRRVLLAINFYPRPPRGGRPSGTRHATPAG